LTYSKDFPILSTNRRRADKHPVLTRFRNLWIGLSTVAAASTTIFLIFGFDFKTPATWLEANQKATTQLVSRVAEVESRVQVMENILVILARDACNRLTPQQLLVTPQCDIYTFPRRIR